MKHLILIAALLVYSSSISQINYANQVGKKEVKRGKISFVLNSNNNGDIITGFTMGGLPVGGQMVSKVNGERICQNYNKDHQLDGNQIIMNNKLNSIELYTYRKNEKNGPSFKITNGKIAWYRQYKNNKPTDKDYEVNHSADYFMGRNYTSFEGFTKEKYKSSYALGYFAYSKRAFPIIHVWNNGDSFYGQCIQGLRKEFGVYFYKNG